MLIAFMLIAFPFIPLTSIEIVEINQFVLAAEDFRGPVVGVYSPRKSFPVGLFQQTAEGHRILLLRSIHCCIPAYSKSRPAVWRRRRCP